MKKKSIQKLELKKTTVINLAYPEATLVKGGASLFGTGINTRRITCFSPYCLPTFQAICAKNNIPEFILND
jgi:hypothetical protein